MAADGKPIVSLFVISGIMMLIRKVLNLSFVSYDVITCTMFFDCRFQLFLVSKIKKQSATFLGTGFRRVISGILLLIRIVLNVLFISYDLITLIAFCCRFQLFLVNYGIKIQKQSGQFRDWSSPLLSGLMRLIRVVISYDVIIFNAFFLGRF